MPAKKKNNNKKIATGVGIGVALAAAAAAVYAFSGEKGKKRRAKATKWAGDLKKELIQELKATKVISQKVYHKIIDELGEKYSKLKNVSTRDVAHLANELKGQWGKIHKVSKEVNSSSKGKKSTKKKRRPAKKNSKK